MDWSDEGIVLAARKHGESAAIVTLLTREHGRHLGLVRGGAGRRARGTYEPGNEVAARWRARLEDHLGTFTCELVISHAARLMDEPARLAALAAACAMADSTLPEREPLGPLYSGLRALLLALQTPGWAEAYVRWELALLRDLGFGLDLTTCAATGRSDALVYVSPRTGRAVSEAPGEPYRDRLLPLPAFLLEGEGGAAPGAGAGATGAGVIDGLRLTGHFLEHHVFAPHGWRMPAARTRLVDRLKVSDTISRV